MRFLVFLLILVAILNIGTLFKMAFSVLFLAALVLGFWMLWRLKWVILGIFGLEELFRDR